MRISLSFMLIYCRYRFVVANLTHYRHFTVWDFISLDCEIWGSDCGEVIDGGLVGCDAVWSCRWLLAFGRNIGNHTASHSRPPLSPCGFVGCYAVWFCGLWHHVVLWVVTPYGLVGYDAVWFCGLWRHVVLWVVTPCGLVGCDAMWSCALWRYVALWVVMPCDLVVCDATWSCGLWCHVV
jgi:hypothetical protein